MTTSDKCVLLFSFKTSINRKIISQRCRRQTCRKQAVLLTCRPISAATCDHDLFHNHVTLTFDLLLWIWVKQQSDDEFLFPKASVRNVRVVLMRYVITRTSGDQLWRYI